MFILQDVPIWHWMKNTLESAEAELKRSEIPDASGTKGRNERQFCLKAVKINLGFVPLTDL